MSDGQKWTVCVLVPCCAVSAPEYKGWDRCSHTVKRTPVVKVFDDESAAREMYAVARGWDSTGGWMVAGEYLEPGFRVQSVAGSLTTYFFYAAVSAMPFPTVEAAQEYAEKENGWPDGAWRSRMSLFNITDVDGATVWSSFGATLGRVFEPGDWA